MFGLKFIKFKKKSEQRNNGFTLIEVLVSMLILAIIIAPILGNISQASRINQISRQVQDASTLGQNMMEGLKTQASFADVAKQLIYKNDVPTFDLFSLEDISSVVTRQIEYDETTGAYTDAADPCITRTTDPTGNYIYSLKENSKRKYQFQVSNITYNGRKYCAKIQYDASPYSKVNSTDDEGYNDKDMPILPFVSDDKNAVVALTYQDDWAASTLKVQYDAYYNSTFHEDNGVTNTEIKKDMKRTLILDLSYNDATKKYAVIGKFIYRLANLIPNGSSALNKYEDEFYHKEFDSIENVYLFFAPNLEQKTDDIEIKNTLTGAAADITVYLVEQRDKEKVPDTTYVSGMNSYTLYMDLQEDELPRSPIDNQFIYHTKIRTNLGSTIDKFDGLSRIQYKEKDAKQVNQDVLIERDIDKTRIYNIAIDLYKQPEDATAMFKEDDYIISFTSSKGE